jgi:hypothetical protein
MTAENALIQAVVHGKFIGEKCKTLIAAKKRKKDEEKSHAKTQPATIRVAMRAWRKGKRKKVKGDPTSPHLAL